MAWNEPGGSGGKDPWGTRNDDQGPPDLDEMVRKLNDQLSRLFGGRGGRGGDTGGDDGGAAGRGVGGLLIILLLAVAIWGAAGLYIVDEGRRGVVLQLGAYHDTSGPGLHWYAPLLQQVELVDVESIRSIELGYRADEALMLTQDENIIDIKFAVQYQVKDARHYLFNVRDPDETLREALESAVREVVGRNKMDFVITGGRAEVVTRARELLQGVLDEYQTGLLVTSLNMQDAQPPQQVQGAFADAVKAREDEVRLKNEAEAYANDVLPRARGQAARIMEEAQGYKDKVIAEAEGESARFVSVLTEYRKAPEVTAERLYIDAMESVLSASSKVLIDSGSNNLIYLPLDRLTNGGGDAIDPAALAAAAAANSADAGDGNLRNTTIGDRTRDTMRRREVR